MGGGRDKLVELFGWSVGDSEDGAFWTAFFRGLRARGLSGVHLVISDHHLGPKAAIASVFLGSAWQRCRVHFVRNVVSRVPKASAETVAAAVRTVFAQPDAADVRRQLDEVVAMLAGQFRDVAPWSPTRPRTSSRSPTSPRRTGARSGRRTRSSGSTVRSIGAPASSRFPNDASIARLITAVVVATHDEWAVAGRRYLSEQSMAKLAAGPPENAVTDPLPVAVTA